MERTGRCTCCSLEKDTKLDCLILSVRPKRLTDRHEGIGTTMQSIRAVFFCSYKINKLTKTKMQLLQKRTHYGCKFTVGYYNFMQLLLFFWGVAILYCIQKQLSVGKFPFVLLR